jgi:hypothetical protein
MVTLHALHTQQLASLLKQHGVSQDATTLAQSLGIATPPTAGTTPTAAASSTQHSSARRSSSSSSSSSGSVLRQAQRRHSAPALPETATTGISSSSSCSKSAVRAPKTLDYTHLVNADNTMHQQQQQQRYGVVHSSRGAPAFEPATPTARRVANSSSSSAGSDVKCCSSSVESTKRRVTPVLTKRAAAVAPDRTPVSSVSSALYVCS